jgi:transglutaminase/protease-like cytokinesis protein 3
MNESTAYQFLYKNALYPVLNSNIAKQIPVIINNSFGKPDNGNSNSSGSIIDKITGPRIRVIEYFNGVTLDEAIKSNDSVDDTAKRLVGNEGNSRIKGLLIYQWICQNIKYDYNKALKVSTNPKGISSGSIIAFNTHKGICFDFSALYVSMCRAVGLKVRIVTGLAYSGVAWGDHAWNQVYCSEEKRWMNVDTTFGTVEDYFDKKDFGVDHKNDEIQGEWGN